MAADTMTPKNRVASPVADDPPFLSEVSDLDRGLSGPVETPLAELPPLITIPGQRPLLDLFPVFFPEEAHANLPQAPPLAGELPPAARERPRMPALPLTYEAFFGLRERPFGPGADAKFLYHSAAHDRVAQELLGAIGRRDRLVVVTGKFGVGKTTLCRTIVEELDRRTLTAVISEPFVSIDELLKALLVDFGVMSRERLVRGRLQHASQRELADALRGFLVSLAAIQAFAVVVIDDAQNLAIQVLEDLRILIEMRAAGKPRQPREPIEPRGPIEPRESDEPLIQLILAGEPELLTTFRQPSLDPIRRHVSLETTLHELAREEVGSYVFHRLGVAGNPHIDVDEAALSRIYDVTRGNPRRVNLVCDRALAEGQRLSVSMIDQSIIDAAADAVGLAPPLARKGGFLRSALAVATLTMLAIGGAAVAAFLFRNEIAAIVSKWQGGP